MPPRCRSNSIKASKTTDSTCWIPRIFRSEPSFPKLPIFAGGGFGAGLALGLGLALLLEMHDTSMRSEHDVEVVLRLPVLAMIPVIAPNAGKVRPQSSPAGIAQGEGTRKGIDRTGTGPDHLGSKGNHEQDSRSTKKSGTGASGQPVCSERRAAGGARCREQRDRNRASTFAVFCLRPYCLTSMPRRIEAEPDPGPIASSTNCGRSARRRNGNPIQI